MAEHKSKHKGDWTDSNLQFRWGPHMSIGQVSDEMVKQHAAKKALDKNNEIELQKKLKAAAPSKGLGSPTQSFSCSEKGYCF